MGGKAVRIVFLTFCLFTLCSPSRAWALIAEDAEQMGRDAVALHASGDVAGAEDLLNRALALLGEEGTEPGPWERSDNWERRARLYLSRELADLRLTQGRPAEARSLLSTASVLARGDAAEEAHVLNQQGIVDWRGGNLTAAERAFSEAMGRYDGLGSYHDASKAMVRGNLGLVLLDRFTAGGPTTDLGKAEVRFSEALSTFQALDIKEGMANQWGNLGLVYLDQKRLGEAKRAQEKALALCREIGDRIGEIDALGSLGRVAEENGDTEAAAALYRQAFDQALDLGYARGIAHHGLYLADLYLGRGDPERAESYGLPALEVARDIGKTSTIGHLLALMTRSAIVRRDCEAARSRLRELWSLGEITRDSRARSAARRLSDGVDGCGG